MKKWGLRILSATLTFTVGLCVSAIVQFHLTPVAKVVPNYAGVNAATNLDLSIPKAHPPDNSARSKLQSQKSKYLDAIEIINLDTDYPTSEMRLENTADQNMDMDLDLGDSIENQIILLHPYPKGIKEFKIEWQYETSFTVYGEGPHADLTDWKHYRSAWREIKKVERNIFLTPKLRESDYTKFPRVTKKEIYNAVLAGGDKGWAEETLKCKNVTTAPCGISVSKMSFRIKVKENGHWKIINQINFMIPMGC